MNVRNTVNRTDPDRAGFAIVSSGMRECMASPDGINAEDQATMEKLFLTLA